MDNMDPTQQACLKLLLEYFPEIEIDLEHNEEHVIGFAKKMSQGSCQVLKWKIGFGSFVMDEIGVMIKRTSEEGQSVTEVFASDILFAYYLGQQECSFGSRYYSAVEVDPSSSIITEAEASPVNLRAEGFLFFTKIWSFASVIKDVFPKLKHSFTKLFEQGHV
mmetsp:Transcript_24988/g.62921  ORF Transcript_24988/g.62921 Transcript_24988/m.62921 type:complete len:163 (-) Transcript_24988:210-698(-)|eukprot:CAMPEP_0113893804 /NCGR_PEP_ID=MMETSP0780_2-20120614/16313_1 /TAXON_ID=652834 /ORGANISM="Palpitomonas bilix" /LENGTH=162 /DNA_ID=CAMNT_0000884169 /DNA_START=409 /DNA_END=897 /DNA_ORIENTATION=- /assembly_acc=CAM_ASM_000599